MKFHIVDLPIEPIEGRYSTQWQKWFREAYTRNNMTYSSLLGRIDDSSLSPSNFLDPYGTFKWKFTQLELTIRFLKQLRGARPVIFLHDGWFPGIECFKYIAEMTFLEVKLCAFWHAGSYDNTDLLGTAGLHKWFHGSEKTWFSMCDAVFVGSHYHKMRLISALGTNAWDADKIHVVGCPVEVPPDTDPPTPRENIVVFPHRISTDKRPWDLEALQRDVPNAEFIRTKDLNLSKEKYFKLLRRAKVAVSTANHENFGIAMVEAAMSGCYPVVPDSLAYKETMSIGCRYNKLTEASSMIKTGLAHTIPYDDPYLSRYNPVKVTDDICHIIRKIGEK